MDRNTLTEIISLGTDGFSLIFDPSDVAKSLDGHAWSAVIEKYCRSEKFPTDQVTFDAESDLFSAHSSDRKILEDLALLVGKLVANSKSIQINSSDTCDTPETIGDLSNAEFVDWMCEAGFDMEKKQSFEFQFGSIGNINQALKIKDEIKTLGYESNVEVIDDEVYFDVVAEVVPTAEALDAIEAEFAEISKNHGIEYFGFGVAMEDL